MNLIISPKLANGDSRVRFGSRLPDSVKEGLRAIAHKENRSMSYIVEDVIIDYFNLRRPAYKKRKSGKK